MSSVPLHRVAQVRRRRARALGGGLVLTAMAVLALALSPHTSTGTEPGSPLLPAPQSVIGAPAGMKLLGSSPAEAAGETWGYVTGLTVSNGFSIVRYTDESGAWHPYGPALDAEGRPLAGFMPAAGPLAGNTTAAGGVAIVGEDAAQVGQVLVRDPGGPFKEAPTPTVEPAAGSPAEPNAVLKAGETLTQPSGEGVLMAAVDQPSGHTAVLLVPFESAPASAQSGVLFYDGTAWTREPICVGISSEPQAPCTPPASGFKVLAIGASSPQNAWLLARGSVPTEGVALFSREMDSGKPRWVQRALGEPNSQPGETGWLGDQYAQAKTTFQNGGHEAVGVNVAALANGQPLTVSSQGVWIDGQLSLEIPHQPLWTASFTLYYDIAAGRVRASWCSVPAQAGAEAAQMCTHPLEDSLPAGAYRSFAWPGAPNTEFGERVITGLKDGVSLSLRGAAFARVLGIGGESGTGAGAAYSSPEEGWLADKRFGRPLTHLTMSPEPDRVQAWPVPFQRPLTAVAEQPGAIAGELNAQALAVGNSGQVARYIPGQGWRPEALLSAEGEAQKEVNLRGVAWPAPNRAYAVGTKGAMWRWRAESGLWEPDPARPPNLFLANFTGIAFDPSNPLRGYAVGQQGLLLRYGKSWEQEALPAGLAGAAGANFTSVAFAGDEALATYQIPSFTNARTYSGGVLVNDGSGWRIDTEADAALGKEAVPVRVAGLPDGGAAIATSQDEVIERQGAGAPWQPAPAGPTSGYPVALAPFREAGGTLRAVVSVEPSNDARNRDLEVDEALKEPAPAAQAPVATAPYPLPGSGYVLRETAAGWRDEEHAAFPSPNHGGFEPMPAGQHGVDWPNLPDAVLAFALDPSGEAGWAVGGQTGEINIGIEQLPRNIEAIQTAGVMRYPASGSAPAGFSVSPEQTAAGNATFAIGGNAQCATACAALAEDELGPDRWLSNAIERAGAMSGVSAFLYTGPRVAPGLGQPGGLGAEDFKREEERYAEVLTRAETEIGRHGRELKGSFAFAAPSEADLDEGGLGLFSAAMGAHTLAGNALPPPACAQNAPQLGSPKPPPAGTGAYAFEANGVCVVVLDYSHPGLGEPQQCWLARQLARADAGGTPAIVIGNRGMNAAADAAQVTPILVAGTPPPAATCKALFEEEKLEGREAGASAYFFDAPEQNLTSTITDGRESLETFGSGTLGYVANALEGEFNFLGASGFLLSEVELAKRNPRTNRAPVHVRLIPDISDLALNATNGVLLRRSRPALFKALARRPHAGLYCADEGSACLFTPNPYVPIPSVCQGTGCTTAIFPEYTFTSSNPDKGQFVEADPASPEGTTVLHGADGKPIPDEPRSSSGELTPSERFDERVGENGRREVLNERGEVVPREESGLFCAYNAGETTVTIHAGGLSYSQAVTIQAGSVEQPCGTVPLRNPPAPAQQASLPVPPPAPAPAPAATPRGTLTPPPLPPPLPVPVLVPHVQPRPPVAPLPAVPPPAQLYPIVALVPPPAPPAARPTPPSGTAQVPAQSPVSQPVGVAEQEHEEQGAAEIVHHMTAYRHRPEEAPLPAWPLALVLLAAAAGVGLRGGRPELARAQSSQPRHRPAEEARAQTFTSRFF